MSWEPISFETLSGIICKEVSKLNESEITFWEAIKIPIQKWDENTYGKEGNGFWAVGLLGTRVIWYNDIEDGFNISNYTVFGKIDDYLCNQDEIRDVILNLQRLIKLGFIDKAIFGPPV